MYVMLLCYGNKAFVWVAVMACQCRDFQSTNIITNLLTLAHTECIIIVFLI